VKTYKYVTTNNREVVMFSPSIEHSTFRDLPGGIRSAGFVIVDSCKGDLMFSCYGESLSLGGIKSRGKADEHLFEISGKKEMY
jgi:hypothetical protein